MQGQGSIAGLGKIEQDALWPAWQPIQPNYLVITVRIMLNATNGKTMKRPKALAIFKKRIQFARVFSILRMRSTTHVLPDLSINS